MLNLSLRVSRVEKSFFSKDSTYFSDGSTKSSALGCLWHIFWEGICKMSWKQFVQKSSYITKSSKVRVVKGSRNIECIIMQQWFVKWLICILFSPKCLYRSIIKCSLLKYSSVLIFHGVWLGSNQPLHRSSYRQEVLSPLESRTKLPSASMGPGFPFLCCTACGTNPVVSGFF